MFGPLMRFNTKTGLVIEMGPLSREVMPEFVTGGGMQSELVSRHLGRQNAPVLEDEYEYFDKVRADKSCVSWGVYVIDGESRTLVGTTALHGLTDGMYDPYKSGSSGFMIFRPEFWGKGIAGACHRARTMYAFDSLGLVVIRSSVIRENIASQRAIESVGYYVNHFDRMEGLRGGEPRVSAKFHCVNPDNYVWKYWWRGEEIPEDARDARKRTRRALDWARKNVQYL